MPLTPPRGPQHHRIVEHYDSQPLLSGVPSVSGVVAIALQVQSLAASGSENFIGTSIETFQVPALLASGAEAFTGTATIAFSAPGLHSDPPLVLAIDEPHHGRPPRRQIPVSQPPQIPFYVQIEPTVVPLPLPIESEPDAIPMVAIDNHPAIVALFAAGMLDEAQYAALLVA